MIRKANSQSDVNAVNDIYQAIFAAELAGVNYTGWREGWYPLLSDAQEHFDHDNLFVMENEEGKIIASVALDNDQTDGYRDIAWKFEALPEEILVIHLLVVHPEEQGKGISRKILDFSEDFGRENGYKIVRIDTATQNIPAQKAYSGYGYLERGAFESRWEPGKTYYVCYEKEL
ncbi:MAG: GNAT family N-acetyltransferase [Firmicutes bacterium]|nr:GNAT family N-acetyltransferase [Bacillota bacterium]